MPIKAGVGILDEARQAEQLRDLAEELKLLLSETKFSASQFVIEINHKIGETIVNHPAWKKGAHGTGQFMKQLAIATSKSEQHLYFCINFFQKYPKLSNALETLQSDEKKLTWRHIVAHLSGNDNETDCFHKETYEIKIVCCRKCGTRIKAL